MSIKKTAHCYSDGFLHELLAGHETTNHSLDKNTALICAVLVCVCRSHDGEGT